MNNNKDFLELLRLGVVSSVQMLEDSDVEIHERKALNRNDLFLSIQLRELEKVIDIPVDSILEYREKGATLDFCIGIVKNAIMDNLNNVLAKALSEGGTCSEYYNVKNRLFIKIFEIERNKEVLENIPFTEVAPGLAATYHIKVDKVQRGDQEGIVSIIVTNQHLLEWGIDKAQLVADANKSAPVLFPVMIMTDPFIGKMTVVSNKRLTYFGASAIFYPGVAKELAENLETDGFVVLPSSVHETIVVLLHDLDLDSNHGPDWFMEMVTSINAECVEPKERLTDTAYYYDAATDKFDLIENCAVKLEKGGNK